MRTIQLLILVVTIISPSFLSDQRLATKVDEFTKAEIRESGWKTMFSFSKTCRIKFREIDGRMYMNLKYMDGVMGVEEGENVMFLLKDGTVIKFHNPEHEVSCMGCGATGFVGSAAYGIELTLKTSIQDLRPIKYSPIVKIRIYTTDGYIEHKISRGNSENIKELVFAFDSDTAKKQNISSTK